MRSTHNELTKYMKKTMQVVSSAMSGAKIVIVGAGAAGLACAVKLLDSGFKNIQILEAEDRIGGRIYSVPYGANNVDMGAQWCHGEEDNIVYQMVKGKDLLQTSLCTYKDNQFYNSCGQLIDKELTDELFVFAANIMNDLPPNHSSLGHYFIKRFIKIVDEQYGSNQHCTDVAVQFIDWFHKMSLCYNAAHSWFDLSSNGLLEYKECEGDLLLNWKGKGYGHFLEVLTQKHSAKLKNHVIQLNKAVKTIVWNSNHALEAIIHCHDGTFYNADHIVMTVSVGVLKEKLGSMFIPDLPEFKADAITNQGFGTVDKIHLKFAKKWWDDETNFCFLWKESDRMNILNQFPFGPMKDGRSWLEDISGFFVIDSDPTILIGWLLGDFVQEAEQLSDSDIERGCLFLLNKFLGDRYDIPEPESVLISRWYSNPNYRGSYSYHSVESMKRGISNKALAEPLLGINDKPVIQFAGEATHPYYFSTVHGAVETGFREADRIISYYNKPTAETAPDAGHLLSKI